MTAYIKNKADNEVAECLEHRHSFAMIAGAGSGKTSSLVEALKFILKNDGARLLRDGQRVVCITFTTRAVSVISKRLRQNPLFLVSTLHSFLWGEVRYFQNSIREALRRSVLPALISKQEEKDNGGDSKRAREARNKAVELKNILDQLDTVDKFHYGDDTPYSNFLKGEIGHDDLISISADMIQQCRPLRRILSQKYPFFFVDEAQDTFPDIVDAINSMCSGEGLPIVGYFGDPMQQIYEKGLGEFMGPRGSKIIQKEENFRSAPQIIKFLNAFRGDVEQYPAGKNKTIEGSVTITLVNAEKPAAPRNRYTEEQQATAHKRLVEAIESWGWSHNSQAKQLFLARRMIARRAGFIDLHDLFTGKYASTRAQNAYEDGTHFLLKPFIQIILPLVRACRENKPGDAMRVLTSSAYAFRPNGNYANKKVREVKSIAKNVGEQMARYLDEENLGDALKYARDQGLITVSEGLGRHLDRAPRDMEFNPEEHSEDKADWLADTFFAMKGGEIEKYYKYVCEETNYSTQHGVKGEEYDDVVVIFDDIEAAWNNYNFAKMLVPKIAGDPSSGQRERSRKLAYVCFSRAVRNLRILLFTADSQSSAKELMELGYFEKSQISLMH